MRALIWAIRLLLFSILFGFAVKNDDIVVLRFFFGSQWQAPLVLVILLFVVIGALIGVSATMATLYRQQREIDQLRAARQGEGTPSSPLVPHPADLPENY
ncbi:lipopolysaccharide assembly protein LapA domain-containing protein [Zoogloea sp.]|uniref:LapA family protein n=1 Tax=Zoogloea sp. TaxID=49181 RepID=UPI0026095003|nr:lipopolysaccharide assembly protein LapA domain-containing protein [Zoogloea sp.]MDD3353428.1 lipopolysaccharide assembly protein LapA domain-containing protein [Zoogloea sp.]